MIVIEHVIINNTDFTRTYSDDERFIVCGDEQYIEAYDLASLPRVYIEGEKIPSEDEEEQEEEQEEDMELEELYEKAKAYDLLMGYIK